ncbi:M23 family metallopeptidase [Luteolibacter arcticus]|uniref:M23 family metallopeptidase n=1 Tax=Luteolibacter arcticus TaxID=1581411 RepID=A0ABT3GF52_9BACT|nr:M23 family metallopeptidase [Luteolibacter arcticus]MCW1922246.1 M23 family metallopeptidase [Luteolibacter arcticus]
MSRKPILILLALLLALLAPAAYGQQRTARVPLADGFDFPVGKPDATSYYKARGLRLRPPVHFGEDWNGAGGGDTDMGAPVYSIGDGVVTWAYDVHQGWGNVVIIRYAYRDPASGQVRFIDALYGHLREMLVKVGQIVKRGQQVGTIGNNRGMYAAHLHFEIRHNLSIGMHRESVARDMTNWADPTEFIKKYRRLNRDWGKAAMPLGTYQEYQGFKGL